MFDCLEYAHSNINRLCCLKIIFILRSYRKRDPDDENMKNSSYRSVRRQLLDGVFACAIFFIFELMNKSQVLS